MAKISDLFDPAKPGSVKIKCKTWKTESWMFRPFFKAQNDMYVGLTEDDDFVTYKNDDCDYDWELWHPPKQKVKRWLWVYRLSGGIHIDTRYLTDKEAENYFINIIGSDQYYKLPFTEIETEDLTDEP